ncbi:MAG TPA: polysaccharide biosynthesis/export family protein, partial [Xanthomonadales bacterium]|nr:polysaccharide biosynthesis/export family protein [Xanthomonadales bacterium]
LFDFEARYFSLALLLFLYLWVLPASAQDDGAGAAKDAAEVAIDNPVESAGYRLGARDQIRVSVFNQEDLTGDYVLDGDGRFSMPLIGTVNASGLTPTQLAEHIIDRLQPDFLVNPRVSVEVSNYRPYFLVGEVQSTGSFPYVEGITYLTAIAMAGGYSYRAKKEVVFVTRAGDPEELELSVNEKVHPGDIIRVAERFF